jgi:DNA-directed RNA polymerase subunit RPC12/RpoP
MRKNLFWILIILFFTLICASVTPGLSYALPLNCPPGSKVIGIECFDADYNNTTPWYRRDTMPALVSIPVWLVLSTIGLLSIKSAFSKSLGAAEGEENIKQKSEIKMGPQPKQSPRAKHSLPAACPNCGGAIASTTVKWLSLFEAQCPYCGSTIKAQA